MILTNEYVCLPQDIMALGVPKGRHIYNGVEISVSRVDPTWYGKLIIGLTNKTTRPLRIQTGMPLCALIFLQCTPPKKVLDDKGTPHLGRNTLPYGKDIILSFVPGDQLLSRDQVTLKKWQDTIKDYGQPFDIVDGAIRLSADDLKKYVDDQLLRIKKEAVTEATNIAASRAFRTSTMPMLAILVALIVGVLTVVITIVVVLISGNPVGS